VESFTKGFIKWIDVTDSLFHTCGDEKTDFVTSLDVAEHIPSSTTDVFFDLLDRLIKHGIDLSWTKVGQGRHINTKNEHEVMEIMFRTTGRSRFMVEGRKHAMLPSFHWSFFFS
jgi:hypothetical protein